LHPISLFSSFVLVLTHDTELVPAVGTHHTSAFPWSGASDRAAVTAARKWSPRGTGAPMPFFRPGASAAASCLRLLVTVVPIHRRANLLVHRLGQAREHPLLLDERLDGHLDQGAFRRRGGLKEAVPRVQHPPQLGGAFRQQGIFLRLVVSGSDGPK
jgi:hypothetical protein